jgi:hypothetical protein
MFFPFHSVRAVPQHGEKTKIPEVVLSRKAALPLTQGLCYR